MSIKSGVVSSAKLSELNRWDAGFVLSYVEHEEQIKRLCQMVKASQIRKMCMMLPYDQDAYRIINRGRYIPGPSASARTVFEGCGLLDRELATYLCIVFNKKSADAEVQRIRQEAEQKENEVIKAMSVLKLLDQPGLFDHLI